MNTAKMCGVAGTFAFFQALMPMIGWFCIHTIVQYFKAFETLIPWIALLLLGYIGGKMLYDGIKQKEEAYRDALHKFYTKTNDSNEFQTPICYVKISTYEVQAMSYAGIKVANEDGRAKYLSDIRYEIGKFLRMY
jgi:putative Mn2+ efflux pump MntP